MQEPLATFKEKFVKGNQCTINVIRCNYPNYYFFRMIMLPLDLFPDVQPVPVYTTRYNNSLLNSLMGNLTSLSSHCLKQFQSFYLTGSVHTWSRRPGRGSDNFLQESGGSLHLELHIFLLFDQLSGVVQLFKTFLSFVWIFIIVLLCVI